MNKYYLLLLVVLGSTLQLMAQPGTIHMTPIDKKLMETVNIKVPPRFQSLIDSNLKLSVMYGFEPRIFYMGGLTKPRALEFNNANVLHVIDYKANGAIYALPDKNNDDVADTIFPIVTGVNGHDFKFYNGAVYVAEETRVLKCTDLNADGFYETKEVFIDSIGYGTTITNITHHTRTLAFDLVKNKIYLSVGSPNNISRDTFRARIFEYDLDGKNKRVYATGIRNAVGIMIHPKSKKLWANVNGSDNQGNDIPPEWIDIVRENGFYGWPFAYANQVWFNFEAAADYKALKPITAKDSALVSKMVEPAALIQAHSAPMEMDFFSKYQEMTLPQSGIIMALRGSWNRTPATGYKVVFLNQNASWDAINSVSDFATGFLTDSTSNPTKYWARPVGIAISSQDSNDVYMSSDEKNTFIMKFKRVKGLTGIAEDKLLKIQVIPNPFTSQISILGILSNHPEISLINTLGQQETILYNAQTQSIETSNIKAGLYTLLIRDNNKFFTQKLVKNLE